MPELGPYGSVRGARGNSRPYRESDVSMRSGPSSTPSRKSARLGTSHAVGFSKSEPVARLALNICVGINYFRDDPFKAHNA